jgi:hypothetical protein
VACDWTGGVAGRRVQAAGTERPEILDDQEPQHSSPLFAYLPELRVPRQSCLEVYRLFNPRQVARLARRRRTPLLKNGAYRRVTELELAEAAAGRLISRDGTAPSAGTGGDQYARQPCCGGG